MNKDVVSRIEYENQLFGFSGDELIEAYTERLKEQLCEVGVNSVVDVLKKKLMPVAERPAEAERVFDEMTETLRCNYERGVDYALTQTESKIKELFRIPDNILLPEDSIIESVLDVDEAAIAKEITDAKQALKNIAYMTQKILKEQELAEKTIATLEEANSIVVEKIEPSCQ